MQSLLAGVRPAQLFTDPFPHIVVVDPLPDELCRRLVSEYPSAEWIARGKRLGSNQRFSCPASRSLTSAEVSPLWKEFVRVHTSRLFFSQVIDLFGEHIRQLYPSLEGEIGNLDGLRVGVRQQDDFSRADVLLDAQICLNTPVLNAPSSVRRFHVDLPNKLFAGLYYLRHPDDTSSGGDLQIGKFREKPYGFRSAEIADRHVDVVKTIPYRNNVLVMFVNSIHALHAVTVRSMTSFPRYLFNLLGEVQKPLFDLNQYQEGGQWLNALPLKALRTIRRHFSH
jgi:hypothetical protein